MPDGVLLHGEILPQFCNIWSPPLQPLKPFCLEASAWNKGIYMASRQQCSRMHPWPVLVYLTCKTLYEHGCLPPKQSTILVSGHFTALGVFVANARVTEQCCCSCCPEEKHPNGGEMQSSMWLCLGVGTRTRSDVPLLVRTVCFTTGPKAPMQQSEASK